MRRCSSSITTLATSAGASALTTNVAGSGDHGTMSIFSPCNSPTTAWTRLPRIPTHAPIGSIPRDYGDLRPTARITSYRLDLNNTIIDLRHFLREQFGHELRVGTGQEDL